MNKKFAALMLGAFMALTTIAATCAPKPDPGTGGPSYGAWEYHPGLYTDPETGITCKPPGGYCKADGKAGPYRKCSGSADLCKSHAKL